MPAAGRFILDLWTRTLETNSQSGYVAWLGEFGDAAFRVLKPAGSFVLDLGGAYERGRPVRSLYNFRALLDWCDRIGYRLAEEFFWYNPAKLPSPIEWVNKRKLRAKDAVNTVWWFSKTTRKPASTSTFLAIARGFQVSLLSCAQAGRQAVDRADEIGPGIQWCGLMRCGWSSALQALAHDIGLRTPAPARFHLDLGYQRLGQAYG